VVSYLLNQGVVINGKCQAFGKTALHNACEAGQVGAIGLLMDRGADPSIRDHDLRTPVMLASMEVKISAIEALLKRRPARATIDIKDKDETTPLFMPVGTTT